MILNALEEKPIPIYGKGAQIRDWLYVSDHCDAIWKALFNGTSGETYCIGGDTQIENIELVKMICRILDERNPCILDRTNNTFILLLIDLDTIFGMQSIAPR